MVWIDRTIAGLVLLACVVLFVRLCLGARLRGRLDGRLRGWSGATRRALQQTVGFRTRRRNATRAAQEAIERARRGSWKGNVYSAKTFKDKPRKPH